MSVFATVGYDWKDECPFFFGGIADSISDTRTSCGVANFVRLGNGASLLAVSRFNFELGDVDEVRVSLFSGIYFGVVFTLFKNVLH